MSADQQFINFGSSANDGTGDPLRTAFIKTDLNFDSIWNAGPVGSNVTILNNTIRTVNVNGNLVLQPDGIGQVLSSATVAPSRNLSYDLGSQSLRWRAIYAGSITANNITYNGNVFTGNLEGNVVYSDGETLLINNVSGEITANSVAAASAIFNSIRSDDSTFVVVQDGLTVEGTVQAREDIDVTGNIAASYFIGNGSLLSGVTINYGNANVAAFLVDYNGLMSALELDTQSLVHEFPLTISTNGGGEWEFAGNTFRGPQGGTWSEAADTIYFNSPANGFVNMSSLQSGNVVSEIFMEHSFIRFFVDNGVPAKTWQMNLSGEFSVPGDIIPQSNGTASLGNSTNQWANITANNINATTSLGLPVYANATTRDSAIASPQPGMMIFVTDTGLQVRGATAWNTVAGTAT